MGVSVPVPERPTVWGVVVALAVMVSDPWLAPCAVGVNATEIVQLAPAAKAFPDVGQVVAFCVNSPSMEMPEIVSAAVWSFLRVTTFTGLVVRTTWPSKARSPGDR